MSGEHIANIIPKDRHMHYSAIRPSRHVKDKGAVRYALETSSKWDDYYWPIIAESEIALYRGQRFSLRWHTDSAWLTQNIGRAKPAAGPGATLQDLPVALRSSLASQRALC